MNGHSVSGGHSTTHERNIPYVYGLSYVRYCLTKCQHCVGRHVSFRITRSRLGPRADYAVKFAYLAMNIVIQVQIVYILLRVMAYKILLACTIVPYDIYRLLRYTIITIRAISMRGRPDGHDAGLDDAKYVYQGNNIAISVYCYADMSYLQYTTFALCQIENVPQRTWYVAHRSRQDIHVLRWLQYVNHHHHTPTLANTMSSET